MDEKELSASDLKLLGSYYSGHFPLSVVEDATSVSLIAIKPSKTGLYLAVGMITVFYLGFLYLLVASDAGRRLGGAIWIATGLVGVLSIFGPLIAVYFQWSYVNSMNPLVEWNRVGETIEVLAGKEILPESELEGLIGVCLPDSLGESKSELQLIRKRGKEFEFVLLATSLSDNPKRAFGDVLREFGRAANCRGYIATPSRSDLQSIVLTEVGED